ncbi:MAG: hypothetical protein D6768_12440, partial [Chloroflexi bacterium]
MDDQSSRQIKSLVANPAGQATRAGSRSGRSFEQARRWAFLQDALSLIRYQPTDLLPFEEVREKLNLGSRTYLGRQEIPLDKIVGSVGRYEDFTRTFLPRNPGVRSRWENIDQLAERGGWPPIELYKVSDTYFVRDGNHRV